MKLGDLRTWFDILSQMNKPISSSDAVCVEQEPSEIYIRERYTAAADWLDHSAWYTRIVRVGSSPTVYRPWESPSTPPMFCYIHYTVAKCTSQIRKVVNIKFNCTKNGAYS